VLEKLRAMGVQVCVDDFGTGYSSLAYLSHFKIDSLKIDRSFVSRIDREQRQGELVQAIINMAHDLKIEVVAEGVETVGQLDLLKSMSCPYMQGFCFGKPASPRQAAALLRGRMEGGAEVE
jgi:EAL domain-containing protein (putative c-di-GMP-specific phosphodiesterase class I)